jgi:DNA-binding FadR family transcriptional regulator
VREALRALVTAGLIVTTAGASGGSVVAEVDLGSLARRFAKSVANNMEFGTLSYAELFDVRAMLEVPSAELAARYRGASDLRQLRELIVDEKSVAVSDASVADLNVRFHEIIAEASGNRLLASLVSALHVVTRPLAYVDTSPVVGRQSVVHHIRIVEAIAAGDADEAAGLMAEHLRYLRGHVVLAAIQAPV